MKKALILLAAMTAAAAQDDRLSETPKLPQRVMPPPGSRRSFREWCGAFCHGPVESATLHALVRRGADRYVVFSTIEPRDEKHIHWLAIRDAAVVGYQQHDLESPWRPISGGIDGWRHGVLSWSASGMFSHDGQLVDEFYSAFFDPNTPDKGFQIRESHPQPRK